MTPEALSAGKYAAYIWPAYGLSLLVLVAMVVDTLAKAARWRAKAEGKDRDRP